MAFTKITGPGIHTLSNIMSHNVKSSGIITAVNGNLTGWLAVGSTASFGGNVSIGGTLTYDDVTNVESVGIITAKAGIHVGAAGTIIHAVSSNDGQVIINAVAVEGGDNTKLCVVGSGTPSIHPSTIASSTLATFRMTGGLSHAAGISIMGGSTGSSALNFGDRDSELIGRVLYNHTTDNLQDYMGFYVQGDEKLRVTGIGSVQISGGNGNLQIDNNGEFELFESDTSLSMTGSSKIAMDFANNVARIRSSTNGSATIRPLAFFMGAEEKVRIKTDGSVGIGTDDPNDKLSIHSPANSLILGAKETTTQNHIFQILGDDSAGNGELRLYKNSGSGTHQKTVEIASAGNSYFLQGNVGIGTDNISQPITIHRSSAGQGEFGVRFQFENLTGPTQTSSALLVGTYGLKLKNYNSSRNFLFETGDVGIGTNNPARILHLHESSSDTCQLHITNSTTGTSGSDGVSFALGSDESLIINQRESNHISLKTADTEKLRITSEGKVGISSGNIDPENNQLLIRGASTVGTHNGHIMLTGDGATVNEGPQIVFSESGSGSNFAGGSIGFERKGSNSIGDLVFGTRQTSGVSTTTTTEVLRLNSSGTALFKGNGANFEQVETNPYDSSLAQANGKITIKGDLSGGNYFGWRQKGVAAGSVTDANAVKKLPTVNDFTYPNSSNGMLFASTSKIGFSASAESPQYASGVTMLFDASGLAIGNNNAFDCNDTVSNSSTAKIRLLGSGKVSIGTTAALHSSGDNLIVGSGSGEEGMSIYSGNGSGGVINFADGNSGSDRYDGRIIYNHGTNPYMRFHVKEGTERFRIYPEQTYGVDDFAQTGTGNQGNVSQAHPTGVLEWQTNTDNGINKYNCYIQATGGNEKDMYITIRNSGFYRITIKASHNSTSADVAMYLIYGLNSVVGGFSNRITEVVSSGSFSCSDHNTHVNSHDSTVKIAYSGSANQGLRALVETIGGF